MQLEAHTFSSGGRVRRKTTDRRARKQTLAARADRYKLYQESVQDPESDVIRLRRMFERQFGRPPRLLREDFCGTAAFAAAWVKAHRENQAWGVDLDPDPLDWGRRNNLAPLRPDQRSRVHLLEGDVRTTRSPKVDVLVAYNFSYFLFKKRDELLRYFRRCHAQLKSEGLFVIDAYGGPDSMEKAREKRKVGSFTYIWDQHSFDPITHDATCHIHFEFRDGSKIERAWTYHWRLWSIAELRDLLSEAGFETATVYWEGTELSTNEPNGIFRPREHADEDPAWVAYVVAAKT